MGVVLTDAAPGFQNVLDRRIDSGAARLVLEQCVQRAGHLQKGGEGVAAAARTVGVGERCECRARTGEAARRQELPVVERCRNLRQGVPGVLLRAIRQVGRRRGHDIRPRADGGVLVRPMDIEQMAGVAEGVLECNRGGDRIDLEREGGEGEPRNRHPRPGRGVPRLLRSIVLMRCAAVHLAFIPVLARAGVAGLICE